MLRQPKLATKADDAVPEVSPLVRVHQLVAVAVEAFAENGATNLVAGRVLQYSVPGHGAFTSVVRPVGCVQHRGGHFFYQQVQSNSF